MLNIKKYMGIKVYINKATHYKGTPEVIELTLTPVTRTAQLMPDHTCQMRMLVRAFTIFILHLEEKNLEKRNVGCFWA